MLVPSSWGTLREHNPCHLPSGSAEGGRFAGKGEGNCSGAGGSPLERQHAGKIAAAEAENAKLLANGDSKSHHYTAGEGYNTARQAVHERIIAEALAGKPGSQAQPVAVLMGGMTASGKTTAAGKLRLDNKVYMNADDFKAALPEYTGNNAAWLHEESSDIAEVAFQVALAGRYHMVLDSTMKSLGGVDYNDAKGDGGVAAKIEALKKAGYRVELRFTDVSIETSVERSLQRFIKGQEKTGMGRYVPVGYIRANADATYGTKPRRTAEHVKHVVDAYVIVDNNGSSPRVVEHSGKLTERAT